eukprot:maker-scaffold2567_size14419-snap-gene-0.5 protein:Tk10674 transcript:maker-scaffold2567_size14419-snap-gene-0.5-mRNA-1 annotation:"tolloid-like protein 1"
MRNFIAVSFVTLLLVLGSSQDPRTRFTPRETEGDQGTITKNLVSGQCLNVTSPNHPGNYPNSGGTLEYYTCTMDITIPPSQGMTLKLLKDSFDVERYLGTCDFDFLELENIITADDDDDVDRTNANDRFCGTLTNDKALDSKPEVAFVTLKFRADDFGSRKGFLATLCVP